MQLPVRMPMDIIRKTYGQKAGDLLSLQMEHFQESHLAAFQKKSKMTLETFVPFNNQELVQKTLD